MRGQALEKGVPLWAIALRSDIGLRVLTEKPRKGQRVAWRNSEGQLYAYATVLRIEDTLCWIKPDDGSEAVPFIWFFTRDNAFNQLAEIVEEPAYNKEVVHVHA